MTDQQRCGTCKFFLRQNLVGGQIQGICRLMPPTAALVNIPNQQAPAVIAAFTPVPASGWCGQWHCAEINNTEPAEAFDQPELQ